MQDDLTSPAVLISTVHDKISHLIATDLTRRGVRVEGIGSQCPPALRLSRLLTRFHAAPPLDDTARFVDRVCEVVRERRLTMFLPSCTEVNRLASFQPRLAEEANYPFTNDRIVSAVSNKAELAILAEQCGVATPRTLAADSADALDHTSQLRFPLIYKPSHSCDSNGLGIAATPDALCRAMARKTGYVVQEYIDGPLFVWNGVFRNGRLYAVFTFEAIRTSPALCGVSVMRRSIHLPHLDTLAMRLLGSIGYEGFCTLDFLRNRPDGRYLLIDCNPRFPSSIHASLDAGISFPWVLLCLTLGRECPPCDYLDGITSVSVSGHVSRLFRRRPGGPGFPRLLGETLAALRWIHRSEESYLLRPFPFAGQFFSVTKDVCNQTKRLAGQPVRF